jgi:hypothetical protein
MTEPLNPKLFNLLNAQPGGALITSPGVALEYDTEYDVERKRWKLITKVTGEYYVLFCPLCGRTKSRTLYINHAWRTKLVDKFGAVLNDGQSDMLATCFDCHAEREFVPLDGVSRKRVNKIVKYFSSHKQNSLAFSTIAKRATQQQVYIPPPPVILLRDLPPDHRARQYLLNRPGHPVDPDYISDVYGIGYASTFPYGDEDNDPVLRAHQRAHDRIVIPLVKDGKVVHWQARVIDDNDPRSRWQFPPGSKPFPFRNWDMASRFNGVVLIEGFFDEVAAGPSGLTLFTKDMNYQKAEMVVNQWEYIVIALDLKETNLEVTDDNGQKRMGSCHALKHRLESAGARQPPVIFTYPRGSAGKDPSAMGPHAFWAALQQQLRKEYFDAITVPVR